MAEAKEVGEHAREDFLVVVSLEIKASNRLEVNEKVKKGLPFKKFLVFQTKSRMSPEKIAKVARIPMRTLARRKKTGKLTPEESERLVRFAMIYDQTLDLFEGDEAAAKEWLQRPAPGLANKTPLDLAETELGGREVEALIGRLQFGVYS